MKQRKATSVWNGSGKDSQGKLTTQSGTLNNFIFMYYLQG